MRLPAPQRFAAMNHQGRCFTDARQSGSLEVALNLRVRKASEWTFDAVLAFGAKNGSSLTSAAWLVSTSFANRAAAALVEQRNGDVNELAVVLPPVIALCIDPAVCMLLMQHKPEHISMIHAAALRSIGAGDAEDVRAEIQGFALFALCRHASNAPALRPGRRLTGPVVAPPAAVEVT